MRGVRFYADYGTPAAKRKGGDAPNALAIFEDAKTAASDGPQYDAIAALTDMRNSDVASTGVSSGYLRTCCKRISEAEAYRIHPQLKDRMQEGK